MTCTCETPKSCEMNGKCLHPEWEEKEYPIPFAGMVNLEITKDEQVFEVKQTWTF